MNSKTPEERIAKRAEDFALRKERFKIVGWCAAAIYDKDCYVNKTKGSVCHESLVAESDGNGGYYLRAWMSPTNPLDHLKLPAEDDKYFHCVMWFGLYGKSGERNDDLMVQLVHTATSELGKFHDENATSRKSMNSTVKATANFIKDPHNRLLDAKVEIIDRKFENKVTHVEVHMTKEIFDEWYQAYDDRTQIGESDKDDAKKDKKDE